MSNHDEVCELGGVGTERWRRWRSGRSDRSVFRRSLTSVFAGVLGLVFTFGGIAAGHVLYGSGDVFLNPANWPYLECARGQAAIGHAGAVPDGKAFVFAFAHTCYQSNVRPTGWLRATFDVYKNGKVCYTGTYSYSPAWQDAYGVGGVVCTSSGSGTYMAVDRVGYWYDSGPYWAFGTSASPSHSL